MSPLRAALARLIATWFGSGLVPKAPGTVGSLAALPFAYALQTLWGNAALGLAALLLTLLGLWAVQEYAKGKEDQDPGEIVVDEVVGQWIILLGLPATPLGYVAGFVLFRAFDILKPWPVSLADRNIKGPFGVMLDDVMAALYPYFLLVIASLAASLAGLPQSPLEMWYGWTHAALY